MASPTPPFAEQAKQIKLPQPRRKYLSRKFYEEVSWDGKILKLHPEDVDLIVDITMGREPSSHYFQRRSFRLAAKLRKFTGREIGRKVPLICWFGYAANLVSIKECKEMMIRGTPNQ